MSIIESRMRISYATRWAEGLGAGLMVSLLGLLIPADPHFVDFAFLPQALTTVLVGALLGAVPGALALVGTILGGLLLPFLAPVLGLGLSQPTAATVLARARLPLAATLFATLAAGTLRDGYARSSVRLLDRLRLLVRRNVQLKKMNLALSGLSDELEQRVSGQRDSVSALYARIRKMDSLDLEVALEGLLEAIVAFSQASAAAVYEYDSKGERLVRRAFIGAGKGPAEELGLEDSLEGWVFRNNSIFSLRSVDDYLNLGRVEYEHTVLAYPIKSGDLPWGVLNIAEMPFYRYNPITENNLLVVVELAASYMRKAIDFRNRFQARPRNEHTGLPGHSELVRVLGEELGRRAEKGLMVSVVVVEILGFEGLVASHSPQAAFGLLKDFARSATAGRDALAFHSREDGQLAFILPDIDRQGASLFCLDLTGSAEGWKVEGEDACIEIAFGLASFPGSAALGNLDAKDRPEALIAEAESVLALSKGAYDDHGGSCR